MTTMRIRPTAQFGSLCRAPGLNVRARCERDLARSEREVDRALAEVVADLVVVGEGVRELAEVVVPVVADGLRGDDPLGERLRRVERVLQPLQGDLGRRLLDRAQELDEDGPQI